MRAPDSGDLRRVARSGQPIVNGGADAASLDGRLAGAGMAGNQQHDAVAALDGLLQAPVDRGPGAVQRVAMEIDGAVGLDRPFGEAPVPAAVEGLPRTRRPQGRW